MPPKSSSEELAGVWEAVYGGLLVSQHAQGPLNLWTFLLTTEASINLARATPQPQAYWVKTINSDEKLPEALGQVCCDPDLQPEVRTAAYAAVAAFLDRLCDDGILDCVTHKQTRLTAALQRQFESSQLTTNLPSLLMMAADELNDLTAGSSSGSSVGSSSGSSGASYTPLTLASHLLHVYFRMQYVWPMGVFTSDVAAAAAVPAVELALAVARFLQWMVQQLQQQQQQQGSQLQAPLQGIMPMDKSLFVLHQALVTRYAGRAVGPGPTQIALSLLDVELNQSPCYLTGLGVLLVTMGYATLIKQHKALPGLPSSSCRAAASSGGSAAAASSSGASSRHNTSGSSKSKSTAAIPTASADGASAGSAAAAAAAAQSSSGGTSTSSASTTSSKGATTPAAAAKGSKQGLKGGFFGKGSSSSKTSSKSSTSPKAAAASGASTSSNSAAGKVSSSQDIAAAVAAAVAAPTAAAAAGASAGKSSTQSSTQPEHLFRSGEAQVSIWLSEHTKKDATEAWERMLGHYQHIPADHQQLLRLLNIDPRIAVWMGNYRAHSATVGNVLGIVSMIRNFVPFARARDQQKLRSAEHDALLQQQLIGLSLFALYWSAHHPFTSSDCVDVCENGLMLCRDVLQPWLQQQQQQQDAVPQQQQQQYGRLQVAQAALPLLPVLLTRLLAAMHFHLDKGSDVGDGDNSNSAAAAVGSSSGGSRSPNQPSSSSSDTVPVLETQPLGMATLCQLLTVLLCAGGAWLPTSTATGSQPGSQLQSSPTAAAAAAAVTAVTGAWAPHAVQLTAQFEAFVRGAAAARGVDGLSVPVSLDGCLQPQSMYREGVLSAISGLLCTAQSTTAGAGSPASAASTTSTARIAGSTGTASTGTTGNTVSGALLQAAVAAGPGSLEQLKLFGLLCSLLKYHQVFAFAQFLQLDTKPWDGPVVGLQGDNRWVADKVGLVAQCVVTLVRAAAEAAAAAPRPPAAAGTGVSSGTQKGGVAATLHWLPLFGRCCLHWSKQRPKHLSAPLARTCSSTELNFNKQQGASCILIQMQGAVDAWLKSGATARELTSVGYNLQPVEQQFVATTVALRTGWEPSAGDEEVSALMAELEKLGLQLCVLAVQPLCNNPLCGNVSGPSETLLVSGKSCMCGGCRTAHYCCTKCQGEHWKQHKRVCKALKAATAAAAAAAAAAATAAGVGA